ncbi:hypothetical protein CBF23_008930 [Marinomonas agarivorans]|nr:hypothetical protein CBF23_008930 [Marinomonas agarivorans]
MTKVNDQVTDAVSQMNALLTGGAPSQAMGMLDVTGTETIGMGMFNAITAQQNAQTSASAATTASCAKMLRTEILAPEPIDTKSKAALESALLKANLTEQQIITEMALTTIQELSKSNSGAVNATTVDAAASSAKGLVKSKLPTTELPLFKAAMTSFEASIKKLFSSDKS